MPLYEYVCEECGADFEQLIRGNNHQVTCPACESDHVRKKLSTFAFKGETTSSLTQSASSCSSCSTHSCSGCGAKH